MLTHFIVEVCVEREDTGLELEFRPSCEGGNGLSKPYFPKNPQPCVEILTV